MPTPRRAPSWLLAAATVLIGTGLWLLERSDLFPLWRHAVRWSPSALPSTAAVPAVEVVSGLPVFSLALDEADWTSPERGLLPNKDRGGPDWERPASISYFEGGRLLFASGVGVRMHGGTSAPRLGFRFYFRRRYGPRELAPGVLFGPQAQPIRRLVAHYDVRRDSDGVVWHFVNPLAYDIAGAMGNIVPETRPVRFFVNGQYHGPLVLTERFDEHYFAAHQGRDDVRFDQTNLQDLFDWVSRTRPLTMATVAQRVDVDSLARWFLAVTFAATRDAYQEPGPFLDPSRAQGEWFWVTWDMDQSFRNWDLDSYRYLLERIREPRTPRRNDAEPRAMLLTHLIAEDGGFRDHYKRLFQHAMNHRVTPAFLRERYEHYRDIATDLRVEDLDYLPRLREFFEKRPAFYRRITEQWLNTPPSQPVTLVAPDDVRLMIDGEQVATGYQGLYFPDIDQFVDVPPEHRSRFSGWRVNGRASTGSPRLVFRADGPTRIEALFDQARPDLVRAGEARSGDNPLAADSMKSGPRTATEPITWLRIPAGSFSMGCVPNDKRCQPAELPRHFVQIDDAFEMMDREVTAGDFQAFAARAGRQMPRQPDWYADESHPVVNVTWDEAEAFCESVGGRLPTEEQWEYAARGGLDGRLYPWGDEFRGEANALRTVPTENWAETAPAKSFGPNGFGLHDMAGNVWEWTASPHRPAHDVDPPDDGYERRTIKGGSWNNAPSQLRVSDRAGLSRRGRHNLYVGFRCSRAAR